MNRFILSVLALVFFMLFLSACGSTSQSELWREMTFANEENQEVPLLDGERPAVIFFFTSSG